MRRLALALCTRWWALHSAPQPARDRGNIGVPGWRPSWPALVPGLALLVAVALLAPELVERLEALPDELARWLVWAVCLTVVFAYVARVTTGRAGFPLRGRHGGYRDIVAVQVAGLALFLVVVEPSSMLRPTGDGVFTARAVGFAAGLVAGAHYSYTEKLPPALVRSINAGAWRDGGTRVRAWIVVRLAVVVLVVVAACLSGAGPWPAVAALALALGLWAITRGVRAGGFTPYLHHWFVFLWLAFLVAGWAPAVALATAVFVEGAARWSCAPLWHREPAPVPVEAPA